MRQPSLLIFWYYTTKNIRSKNSQKNLVGQPVFKQIMDLIQGSKFDQLVAKHQITMPTNNIFLKILGKVGTQKRIVERFKSLFNK